MDELATLIRQKLFLSFWGFELPEDFQNTLHQVRPGASRSVENFPFPCPTFIDYAPRNRASIIETDSTTIAPLPERFESENRVRVRVTTSTWDTSWGQMVKVALYGDGPDVSERGLVEDRLTTAFAALWKNIFENPSQDSDQLVTEMMVDLARRINLTIGSQSSDI